MKNADEARKIFEADFNCAQAVLATYAPGLGLDKEQALKIASGFGGGMGRMGEVCGAVAGAFMAIGLKYGMSNVDEKSAKEKTYDLVKEFSARFTELHGSIICRDLIGCDISTPEGRDKAQDQGVFDDLCPKLVYDAAQILEKIL
ncbi:C_GCAxxG_C_C family protein [candidate division WOR-3 bacterium]|nr:C_GCAxxG_C_C family protein [candidate division WOR-3 bacterium]